MKKAPWLIGLVYLLTIALFGELYLNRSGYSEDMTTRIDSYYFSVVTITTLGYGDIHPVTRPERVMAAAEALLGVFLLGLFLLHLSHNHAQLIESWKNSARKKGFLRQYKFFRRQLLSFVVDAIETRNWNNNKYLLKESHDSLVDRLSDPYEFENFMSKDNKANWYNLQNGMAQNADIVRDMRLEFELLFPELRILIASVQNADERSVTYLTGFHKDVMRLLNGRHTTHDPGKYFANFILELLSGRSTIDGTNQDDRVVHAVNQL